MGLVDDILQGLPVNPLLREKVSQLNAEKGAVEEQNAILKDDVRQANMLIEELRQQVKELSHKDDLNEAELNLLQRIAHLGIDGANLYILSQNADVSRPRIEYYLQRLVEARCANHVRTDDDGPHYATTQKGLGLLIEKGLL